VKRTRGHQRNFVQQGKGCKRKKRQEETWPIFSAGRAIMDFVGFRDKKKEEEVDKSPAARCGGKVSPRTGRSLGGEEEKHRLHRLWPSCFDVKEGREGRYLDPPKGRYRARIKKERRRLRGKKKKKCD